MTEVRIEFVIGNQITGEVIPVPNLTLTPVNGIVTPPAVGDIVPIDGKNYRVAQRAYVVERDPSSIGRKSLTWSIVLIPIDKKEVAPNAEQC